MARDACVVAVPCKAPSGDSGPSSTAADLVWSQDLEALPDVAWRAVMLEDDWAGALDAAEAATSAGDLELLGVLRDVDGGPPWESRPDP